MSLQDVESLRREVSRWESQGRQRERRLAELERELLEKTSRAESLRRQLDEATRQLEEATRQLDEATRQLDDGQRKLEETRWRQGEMEQKLTLRLQECEEELARQAATPPRVKVRRRWSGAGQRLVRGWSETGQTCVL